MNSRENTLSFVGSAVQLAELAPSKSDSHSNCPSRAALLPAPEPLHQLDPFDGRTQMEKWEGLEVFICLEPWFIFYIDPLLGRFQFVCSYFLVQEVVTLELVALVRNPLVLGRILPWCRNLLKARSTCLQLPAKTSLQTSAGRWHP